MNVSNGNPQANAAMFAAMQAQQAQAQQQQQHPQHQQHQQNQFANSQDPQQRQFQQQQFQQLYLAHQSKLAAGAGTLNPSSIMNGGRMMPPHQQQQQQQRMNMGGNMMGGMGGSINPAQLLNQSNGNQQQQMWMGQGGGGGINPAALSASMNGGTSDYLMLQTTPTHGDGAAGASSSPPASMAMAHANANMGQNFSVPVPPATPSNAHHPQPHSSSPTHAQHPHMSPPHSSQIQTPHLPSHMTQQNQNQNQQQHQQHAQHPGRGSVLSQLTTAQFQGLSTTLSAVQIQALAERLSAPQMASLSQMPPQERAKVLRHYFGQQQQQQAMMHAQQQQQQQQQLSQQNQAAMMGNMAANTGGSSLDGMGGMSMAGGMGGFTQAQIAQMHRERVQQAQLQAAQQQQQLQQQQQSQHQQQQTGMMDPSMSSMSGMNMGNIGLGGTTLDSGLAGALHIANQQHPQQQQRPMSSSGPHMQQQPGMNMMNAQQQQNMGMNIMMPPPLSIPPRPTTASSNHSHSGHGVMLSASPRPGSSASSHQHPQQPGQQQQITQIPSQPHAMPPTSRPGTAGSAQGRRTPVSAGSPPHGGPQQQQQQQHHQQHPQQHSQQQHQQQLQQQQQQQHGGPVPIQPRPPSMPPAPTRPGTAGSGGSGVLNGGTPSRPGTAQSHRSQQGGPSQPQPQQGGRPHTPFGGQSHGQVSPSQAQNFALQQQQHLQQQQQQQRMNGGSPFNPVPPQQVRQDSPPSGGPSGMGGYPLIAPAPSQPGSPSSMRGVKRKVSETPQPTPTPQQHQQPPQTPRMGSLPPQQQQQQQMKLPGMNVSMPSGMTQQQQQQQQLLMGGAGGGMMGPPVFPRGGSQGPIDPSAQMMNMNMGMGMPQQALSRQPSIGAGGAGLSVNTNVPQSASAPGALGGAPTPLHTNNNNNMFPTPAQALMAISSSSSTPASASVSSPANLAGMSVPEIPAIPQTPQMGDLVRQGSIPPGAGGLNALERKMNSAHNNNVNGGAPPPPSITRVPTAEGVNVPNGTATAASAASSSAAPVQTGPPTIVPALPALPANVQLNPKTTRITVVPLIDSLTLIPPVAPEDAARVKEWVEADKAYEGVYQKMKERMVEEVRESVVRGRGWWEKGFEQMQQQDVKRQRGEKFGVTGIKTGREERRKRMGKREGFKLPRLAENDALVTEQLVPIRLELEVEHHKMRDTFVWNLNDPIVTPEIFAQSIVDDYSLAPTYHPVITKAIQDQLSDYKAHSATFDSDGGVLSPSAGLENDVTVAGEIEDENEVKWWDRWRKDVRSGVYARLKKPAPPPAAESGRKRRKVNHNVVKEEDVVMGPPPVPSADVDAPVRVEDLEEDESQMQEEMRILIKLDIIVGSVKLEDQFEWDLDNNDPSPERFAEVYANELGLAGEFKTAIAHCIREQVQIFQKSLFLVGHPSDGSVLQDDDLRMSLLPSLSTGARSMDQVGAFTPLLNYLSESEIERNEREREKELNRRRRKTTRGRRGVALPDREPPKTLRTPAIGFPEIDAATMALVNAAAAPTSKRAAAAAASVNIANIIASDNGTMVIPAAAPVPLAPTVVAAPKERKPKGLFTAPSYPPHVLRPRAHVKAPTPSTAADASTLMPPIEGDTPAPTSNANPENRGARVVLTTKRARELEREAKEKEYADGQHANYIDGVWHCSNCGCPESIAIGRRKGPLGDKSQCGTCGKFWHRHRRPRPVVYNSTLEFHQGLKDQEEQAKVAASRKKRPQVAQVDPPSSKAATVEPETPKVKAEVWAEAKNTNGADELPERAVSPASSSSSASEPPLAQRVKANGVNNNHSAKSAPPAPAAQEPEDTSSSSSAKGADEASSSAPPAIRTQASSSSVSVTSAAQVVPQWLKDAMAAMQARYPDDKFEVILRKVATSPTPEWRIKCLDCPGKLYTPGPGESLQNYEVHLKNRQHRQKVNQRISGETA